MDGSLSQTCKTYTHNHLIFKPNLNIVPSKHPFQKVFRTPLHLDPSTNNTFLYLVNPCVIPVKPKQVYFDCGLSSKEAEIEFPQQFETDKNIHTEICGNEPVNITCEHEHTEVKWKWWLGLPMGREI